MPRMFCTKAQVCADCAPSPGGLGGRSQRLGWVGDLSLQDQSSLMWGLPQMDGAKGGDFHPPIVSELCPAHSPEAPSSA